MPGTTLLYATSSYDPDGTIIDYIWQLSGTTISAGSVSAYAEITEAGTYPYELIVYDTSGLSASDIINVYAEAIYQPSADAGVDQSHCVSAGETLDIILDGSGSLGLVQDDFYIAWFGWDLNEFGVADVSAVMAMSAGMNEISATVSAVSAGDYTATLTVSASNGVTDSDTVDITLNPRPTASAGEDQNIQIPCSGGSFVDVTFSGDSDTSGATYEWTFNDIRLVLYGQSVTRSITPTELTATLVVTNSATGCESYGDKMSVYVSASSLSINRFEFIPNNIGVTSAYGTTTLYWETSGATSAVIDNDVGWVDVSEVSAGNLVVTATDDITYTISAYDNNGCEKTAIAYASINLGEISACKIKYGYIKLYGPENIRYGLCRNIDLVNYLPTYLTDSDTINLLSAFEGYLNEMYDGTCGYTLATSALEVTACESSACLLSAVDNSYSHDVYATSSTTSASILNTPNDDVQKLFVDNFCRIPENKISILEKISRLTELFDPDLIPIELIQFYAENLGYTVGLSRENIGIDFKDTDEDINQRKYLRFMIRNLPTWYRVKTTRNSIRMMLYTFGLVGDLIYYFTKDYLDPNTSVSAVNPELSNYIITDGMTYKQIQEIKCNLAQWEEFKKNKLKYFNMLKSLQMGINSNWKLTDLVRTSTNEDIENIPDEFFSTPHFRLWFDIEQSIGNFSTDLEKQQLMGQAIMAIKPINTVFEGITAYFQTSVDMYLLPYPRFRKHIVLISDGFADYWSPNPS